MEVLVIRVHSLLLEVVVVLVVLEFQELLQVVQLQEMEDLDLQMFMHMDQQIQ